MPNEQLYRQCTMERTTENGKITHVAWLPSQVSKVGKLVKVDSLGDFWWKVTAAGSMTRTVDDMDNQRDAHRRFATVLCD